MASSKRLAVEQSTSASLRNAIEAAVTLHARQEDPSDKDPGGFLHLTAVATDALQTCEHLQREAVQQARRAEHSWSDIGALLGITRQAAQQRFSSDFARDTETETTKRITWANAGNEMQILKTVGLTGYHLVDLGGLWLEVEYSSTAWEHRREVSDEIEGKQKEIEAEGWEYVGRWFPFHYFKRKLNRKPGSDAPATSGELFPKEWLATYAGHQIRVRNSWNRGIKLFVDDVLWDENKRLLALDRHTPVLRAQVEPETGMPFVVEVFSQALLAVKCKIAVNGQQIAGDSF
jgi:hypothetical protein